MLVAIVCFCISANAQFKSTQKVCYDGATYEFYTDGSCKVYHPQRGEAYGTYRLESNNKEIFIEAPGEKYRGEIVWNGNNVTRITIQGTRWNRCS